MTQPLVRTLELGRVRTAVAASAAVAQLKDYPYFVHKWTRQKRRYALADVSLPDTLCTTGRSPRWDFPVIGVGGTRSPTVETFCLVSNLVRELAQTGSTIISGGVPGVDLAAHLAAADQEGGATVAVLANPVEFELRGHEWHSATVAAQIGRNGAFVSEYSTACDVGSDEFCERLLARDRIISGLCDVFLAFECNEDSGTVDTARRAVAQGKQVRCISSVRRSSRQGIKQLAAEFGFPVFNERSFTPKEMAKAVLSSLTRPDADHAANKIGAMIG